MIVADSNLIAYLLLPGPQQEQAAAVLKRDSEWAAPLLWRSEFRNILALYLRRAEVALADALSLMEEAEDLLQAGEYQVESAPVLRLAERSGCTAYDCEFVHLAQELSIPLVTSDRKLLRSFPDIAVPMAGFTR